MLNLLIGLEIDIFSPMNNAKQGRSTTILTPGTSPTCPEIKTMGPLALIAWLYGPTAPGAWSVLTTSRDDTDAIVRDGALDVIC
jgi:hypothetical protein